MSKLLLIMVVMGAATQLVNGQTQRRSVEGTVLDTARRPLHGVTVRLSSVVDTLVSVSDERGKFTFVDVFGVPNIFSNR